MLAIRGMRQFVPPGPFAPGGPATYACADSLRFPKGWLVLGRPIAIWILAFVAVLAALASFVIALQFLGVIPWAGEEVQFFYGKWAGFALYVLLTIVLILVAYGWLFFKPWSPVLTLLFALFGFFVPFMSVLADTEVLSAALVPMIFSVIIVLLSIRPSVRQALAEGAAQKASAAAAAPAAAPAKSSKPAKQAKSGKSAPAAAPPVVKGFRPDDV